MRIDIITIFPDYFAPLEVSLLGKARQRGLVDIEVHDLRSWARDRHRTVDDSPYGGGPGMVMKPEPWGAALHAITGLLDAGPGGAPYTPPGAPPGAPSGARPDMPVDARTAESRDASPETQPGSAARSESALPDDALRSSAALPGSALPGQAQARPVHRPDAGSGGGPGMPPPRLVVPTPSGRPFTQRDALAYADEPWLVFACGRYEGIDARVMAAAAERMPVDEVSIGDYVLAGGEAAVLVIVEAVTRLLPGVLGNVDSATDDSFAPGPMEGLVEGPTYTKPASWRGRDVPPVLVSGDHAAIARWRRDQALRRTARNRPDLAAALDPGTLDDHDRRVLEEAGFPVGGEGMAH